MGNGIDPQRFNKLCDNVSEIMVALKGSEEYRQKGAMQRIDENEERSKNNETRIDKAWYYVLGAGGAIGLIVGLILKAVEMVFK